MHEEQGISSEQTGRHRIEEQDFPQQHTSFVGRATEVSEVISLLTNQSCCLLSLVGLGGIGKTRLAVQAARQLRTHFAHGVHFVPLQPVRSANFLVPVIANAVGKTLAGSAEPEAQLSNYLKDRETLLLLDNFEHLLSQGGAEQLIQLLSHAPKLKLLVTSREVINLQEEWIYRVRGLSFPTDVQPDGLETCDSVRLFVERAHHVRRDFTLAEEQAGVVRICRLVEGMPLALEIAAAWTQTTSCQVIADQIEQNLGFLSTEFRDVPERHRRMRAVFDQSWNALTNSEQNVFKRLSVFQGGFCWAAAKKVTGATLPLLSSLVNKCLLQKTHGRFHIHELLRQFAAEQLRESSQEEVDVRDRHCAYWVSFLHERDRAMNGGRQKAAVAEIEADLEDIRVAWQWAVAQRKGAELADAADALYLFYQFQSRYREGADAFDAAVECLERAEPSRQSTQVLAEILVHDGWLCIRLGRLEDAQTVLEESLELYRFLGVPPPPKGMATDPLIPLGVLATIHGAYCQAVDLGKEAQQQAEARADTGNLMFASYVLTSAFLAQGRYQAASQAAQEAYNLASALDNRWFMAYCLNDLGNVARALENYSEAQRCYWAGYTLKQEFNDPEGMAVALNHLGHVAVLRQNYSDAERLFQRSLAIYRDIGDRGGLAACLEGLGMTAGLLNEDETARVYFQRALRITSELHLMPLTLTVLASIGEWWGALGQTERETELLALVEHHPATDRVTRDRVKQSLATCQSRLSADGLAAARQHGREAVDSFDAVVGASQIELMVLSRGDTLSKGQDNPEPVPLTPRELEVLQLIGDGQSNQEIATELVIAVGTVKAHASSIYSKLDVNNRAQAVRRAIALNLL